MIALNSSGGTLSNISIPGVTQCRRLAFQDITRIGSVKENESSEIWRLSRAWVVRMVQLYLNSTMRGKLAMLNAQ
jgi:hypothetical protein